MAAIERIVTHAELPTAVVCSKRYEPPSAFFMGSTAPRTRFPTIFPWWGSTIFIWRSSCCAADHGTDVVQTAGHGAVQALTRRH